MYASNEIQEKFSIINAVLFRTMPFFANLLPFLKIVVGKSKSRYGHCSVDGIITLNTEHVLNDPVEEIINTICHEIMHLVTGDHQRGQLLYDEINSKYKVEHEKFFIFLNYVFDAIIDDLLLQGMKNYNYTRFKQLSKLTYINDRYKEEHVRKLMEIAKPIADKISNQIQIKNKDKIKIKFEFDNIATTNYNITTEGGVTVLEFDNEFIASAVASLLQLQMQGSRGGCLNQNDNGSCQVIWSGSQYDPVKWQNEEERRSVIKQASEAAKLAGNMPGGLLILVDELTKPKVNWKRFIKQLVSHKLSIWVSTYAKKSRRCKPGEKLPGMKHFGTPKVVIALDNSGSISKDELIQFLSEIVSMVKQHNVDTIDIFPFDSVVYGPIQIRSKAGIRSKLSKIDGGGGTYIKPFVDIVTKDPKYKITNDDICIIFTDGGIFDLNNIEVISFFRKVRPIVVTTHEIVYPQYAKNIKVVV
jgi:predicted metal-dependent peptidase